MSITVQSLYDTTCRDLLENGGLTLGLVTQQQFLDYLGTTLMDFLRRTGMVRRVYTQRITAGTTQYAVPEAMPEVFTAFFNATILEMVDLSSVYFTGNWTAQRDTPKAWHMDGLPIQTIEIVPPPSTTGTVTSPTYDTFQPGSRNLSVIGAVLASQETWSIGDTLDTIPDSFTPYLVFGVLERIFSMNGETKDEQRALYCHARYEEGVLLGEGIMLTVGEWS